MIWCDNQLFPEGLCLLQGDFVTGGSQPWQKYPHGVQSVVMVMVVFVDDDSSETSRLIRLSWGWWISDD